MTDFLSELHCRLFDLPARPRDVGSFLRAMPAPAVPLPPWLTWTALALLHYARRKSWAWSVARRRLRPQFAFQRSLSESKYPPDHPGRQPSGLVPGMPDWEFRFENSYSFLTHRGTGEAIHLDLPNGPAVVDLVWFLEYVRSHRQPPPVVAQLRAVAPSVVGLGVPFTLLVRAGFMPDHMDEHSTWLCWSCAAEAAAAGRFLRRWRESSDRLWLAAWIGDWVTADAEAVRTGQAGLREYTRHRAAETRDAWVAAVEAAAEDPGMGLGMTPDKVLSAYADAGDPRLRDRIDAAVDDPDVAGTALGLLGGDPSRCEAVFARLGRVSDRAKDEALLRAYAEYLGRCDHRVGEVVDRLLRAARPPYDVALAICLRRLPDRLPGLLPAALRSPIDRDRLAAAAVLARAAGPWAVEVLGAHLRSCDALDPAVEALAALRLIDSHDSHALATLWEEAHPEVVGAPIELVSAAGIYCISGGVMQVLIDMIEELFPAD